MYEKIQTKHNKWKHNEIKLMTLYNDMSSMEKTTNCDQWFIHNIYKKQCIYIHIHVGSRYIDMCVCVWGMQFHLSRIDVSRPLFPWHPGRGAWEVHFGLLAAPETPRPLRAAEVGGRGQNLQGQRAPTLRPGGSGERLSWKQNGGWNILRWVKR